MEQAAFVVRHPHADDAPAMAAVHIEAWRHTYADVFPAAFLAGLDHDRLTAHWSAEIARTAEGRDDGVTNLVGEIDHEVRGIATVGPLRARDGDNEPSGELWMINLHPDALGSGLASTLHYRSLDQLRSDGHHRAALWVVDSNHRARRFYQREGWTDDRITKHVSIGGADIKEARYSISL